MSRIAKLKSIDSLISVHRNKLYKFSENFLKITYDKTLIILNILRNKSMPIIKSELELDEKRDMVIYNFLDIDSKKVIKAIFDFLDNKIYIPKLFLQEFNIKHKTDVSWETILKLADSDEKFYNLKMLFLSYKLFFEVYSGK